MSSWERVKQWVTLTRVWHMYDAKWQNPLESARFLAKYLKGMNKPFYSTLSDCGDHLVIINSREIAFPGQEWRWRVYLHHTQRHGGATWTRAWEAHTNDPTIIVRRAFQTALKGNVLRRGYLARLHVYPDENVPEEILRNVTNQIRPLRPVPKTLAMYSKQEIKEFPKIYDYPENYTPR